MTFRLFMRSRFNYENDCDEEVPYQTAWCEDCRTYQRCDGDLDRIEWENSHVCPRAEEDFDDE